MPELSVVIVSYRTPQLTLRAARSALDIAGVRQVIVVDNASMDESVGLLRGFRDDRLVVVENDRNGGYGSGANLGAQQASAATLIFLNSDAELSQGAADDLAAEVERHAGRCIAGPRLVGDGGEVQRSAGLLPGPFDLAIRALGLHWVASRVARLPGMDLLTSRTRIAREYDSAVEAVEPFDTTMVSGACSAIGRAAFEELGGFDERFFLYFEDADLCRRAALRHIAVRYVPSAIVPHVGGASTSDDYHFGPHHARSMRQYLRKWYGPAGTLFTFMLLWLRVLGTAIANRSPGRAWDALLAAVADEDPRR